ncbi:hypothetical protein BD626DRAFT_566283 [Schizophyllum amplum]|uniref:Uncharacterized protein n=1 Tax=Schizophyllum amplum TaxID=97359 RepID=A0A550CRB0_9AGAR|nr:hypothetical protein BD626DRAFT_566283 [Auriculariopsis ampla]
MSYNLQYNPTTGYWQVPSTGGSSQYSERSESNTPYLPEYVQRGQSVAVSSSHLSPRVPSLAHGTISSSDGAVQDVEQHPIDWEAFIHWLNCLPPRYPLMERYPEYRARIQHIRVVDATLPIARFEVILERELQVRLPNENYDEFDSYRHAMASLFYRLFCHPPEGMTQICVVLHTVVEPQDILKDIAECVNDSNAVVPHLIIHIKNNACASWLAQYSFPTFRGLRDVTLVGETRLVPLFANMLKDPMQNPLLTEATIDCPLTRKDKQTIANFFIELKLDTVVFPLYQDGKRSLQWVRRADGIDIVNTVLSELPEIPN